MSPRDRDVRVEGDDAWIRLDRDLVEVLERLYPDEVTPRYVVSDALAALMRARVDELSQRETAGVWP